MKQINDVLNKYLEKQSSGTTKNNNKIIISIKLIISKYSVNVLSCSLLNLIFISYSFWNQVYVSILYHLKWQYLFCIIFLQVFRTYTRMVSNINFVFIRSTANISHSNNQHQKASQSATAPLPLPSSTVASGNHGKIHSQ